MCTVSESDETQQPVLKQSFLKREIEYFDQKPQKSLGAAERGSFIHKADLTGP